MKKNRTMRLAALLLVLTLITSCFVGGTFAKYITSDLADDTARVAKWGIDVLVSGNLFGTDYDAVDAGVTGNKIVASSTNVNSADTTDVVAPGTMNDTGFTVQISGDPEVAYQVSARTGHYVNGKPENEDIWLGEGHWGVMVKAEGVNAADTNEYYTYNESAKTYTKASGAYDAGTKYYELHDAVHVTGTYYPINWTVESTGYFATKSAEAGNNIPATAQKDLTTLATKLANCMADDSRTSDDNANTSFTLKWEWPFEVGEEDSVTHRADNDKMDTILGNLMANKGNANNGNVVILDTDGETYRAPKWSQTNGVDDKNNEYNLDIVFSFEVIVEQID